MERSCRLADRRRRCTRARARNRARPRRRRRLPREPRWKCTARGRIPLVIRIVACGTSPSRRFSRALRRAPRVVKRSRRTRRRAEPLLPPRRRRRLRAHLRRSRSPTRLRRAAMHHGSSSRSARHRSIHCGSPRWARASSSAIALRSRGPTWDGRALRGARRHLPARSAADTSAALGRDQREEDAGEDRGPEGHPGLGRERRVDVVARSTFEDRPRAEEHRP